MHLERFRAEGVHGYLRFDIRFRKDLTFLTGINGSGKTSAINAIVALITPDLQTLSNLNYSEISVDVTNSGQRFSISSESNGETFSLGVTGVPEKLEIRRYIFDTDAPPSRQIEHEAEYFRDIIVAQGGHPVIRLISSLPTPMFLGLDRRARFDPMDRRRMYPRTTRAARNVFGTSLESSLHDAADLAATNNRDALISAARIGEELRRDMLLNLLTVSPGEYGNLQTPTPSEISELTQIRRDLETFPQIFSLPREDVRKRVLPFLDALQKDIDNIPTGTETHEILNRDKPDTKILQAILHWSANRSQIERIRIISEVVKSYNERRLELQEPVRRYTNLVNEFLGDSGKTISFDHDGYPFVAIDGIEQRKSIASLSSGEAQIFVILTHLSFNENAKTANVFIIDEPELSLHVLWQELFVASVRSANPNIQYIMATHSPSIILDNIEHCIDLTKSRAGGRRSRGKVLRKNS